MTYKEKFNKLKTAINIVDASLKSIKKRELKMGTIKLITKALKTLAEELEQL